LRRRAAACAGLAVGNEDRAGCDDAAGAVRRARPTGRAGRSADEQQGRRTCSGRARGPVGRPAHERRHRSQTHRTLRISPMAGNYTLTIIKPDAFGGGKAGKIIAHLEAQGFRILASRVMHMSQAEAGAFYEVHKERPFYGSLVTFMTSGPCMPMVLEKADAV